MKRHEYADILEAIARGDDVEMSSDLYPAWVGVSPTVVLQRIEGKIATDRLRIKPKTIRIGEFDVPEPMRVAPEIGGAYWACLVQSGEVQAYKWLNDSTDKNLLKNGFIQATKEGAELQLKALLSLTQKAEK